jgi:hypothetical protein
LRIITIVFLRLSAKTHCTTEKGLLLFRMGLWKRFVSGVIAGIGFGLGLLGTALLAVTVSGNVSEFKSGDTISASAINENFDSLKAAIEGITIPTVARTDTGSAEGYVQVGTTLIQWGSVVCNTGGVVEAFPTPFTSAQFRLTLSPENQNTTPWMTGVSASQFTCFVGAGTPNVHYIAIGY